MSRRFSLTRLRGRTADRRGYTMVELVMVMLLLCLFGITVVTVIQAGSHAYQTIVDNKNTEADARIALSCIDVRVRQNDRIGGVEVAVCPINNEPGLLVHESIGGSGYDSWFYYFRGALWECSLVPEGLTPVHENSQRIAYLDGFTVSYDEQTHAIRQTVQYAVQENGEETDKTMSSVIALRSGE